MKKNKCLIILYLSIKKTTIKLNDFIYIFYILLLKLNAI
jgi:hypothetical protein